MACLAQKSTKESLSIERLDRLVARRFDVHISSHCRTERQLSLVRFSFRLLSSSFCHIQVDLRHDALCLHAACRGEKRSIGHGRESFYRIFASRTTTTLYLSSRLGEETSTRSALRRSISKSMVFHSSLNFVVYILQ